ncbi:hypothetical protein OFC63_32540, partial [Escherichia coli]|nr:hypothetical protein [Escherichia coli]
MDGPVHRGFQPRKGLAVEGLCRPLPAGQARGHHAQQAPGAAHVLAVSEQQTSLSAEVDRASPAARRCAVAAALPAGVGPR